jgi:hypothetical protein
VFVWVLLMNAMTSFRRYVAGRWAHWIAQLAPTLADVNTTFSWR